ncbi:MAG: DNA repair protein RecO [Alphaproteobacteria bacterium]
MSRKKETTEAIALKRIAFRESDRIFVLLTRELGIVRALAKGVRRSKKRFGGVVDLLNHLEVELTARKSEIMLLNDARLVQGYCDLNADPMRLAAGFYLAEVAAAFAAESQPEPEIFACLAAALSRLCAGHDPAPLSRVLELRVMAAAGLAPRLDVCTITSRKLADDEEVAFEPLHGGAVCLGKAETASPRLSPATRRQMMRILAADAADVWSPAWTREQLAEARAALHAAVTYYHGRPLRARSFAEAAAKFLRERQAK